MLESTLTVQQGRYVRDFPVTLDIQEDRIFFIKSAFALKDEIKAFKGCRWHGFEETNPRKIWSIENCPRNIFQLKSLMGEEVYGWFDAEIKKPLVEEDFDRPEFEIYDCKIGGQQVDMVNRGLQYHYQIWGAEPGMGKTLSAIELMERSGKDNWWYVGPLSALESVERDVRKWNMGSRIKLRTMTYEKLTSIMKYEFGSLEVPDGIILDETDLLKNCTTQRSIAAQSICDRIREKHGFDGYAILMSGTPSAKSPGDLWSQCEISWPGFLREGSKMAFDRRYAITSQGENQDGVTYTTVEGWNEEEVAQLKNRYQGLMTVYRKVDWLCLPGKEWIVERCQPSNKVLRVAKSLANIAPNVMTALTWLRALSSGFQYRTTSNGMKECPVCKGSGVYDNPDPGQCPGCMGNKEVANYERETVLLETPKDDIVRKWLDKCEPHGRIVLAAGFRGSVDKLLLICKERGWPVCCVDGRGWRVYDSMGNPLRDENVMDFWEQHDGKVAFVGNPESCGYGLTLTLANVLLFYDNSFRTVKRLQMVDRIHRLSMDLTKDATIVDIVHLPVDQLVLDVLNENRKLELLTLDAVNESIGEPNESEQCEVSEVSR